MILQEVWGPEWVEDAQTPRVHVGNLRKKTEPHPGGPHYPAARVRARMPA